MNSLDTQRTSPDAVEFGPRSPLAVRSRRVGSWDVVEIEGEMDLRVAPAVVDVHQSDPWQVVFDLHGVTFMDCSGLSALLLAKQRAGSAGGCVRVAARSGPVLRLLRLTDTEGDLPSFDTVAAAVCTPWDGSRLRGQT
jgi:anti-sigma B factor antagonist